MANPSTVSIPHFTIPLVYTNGQAQVNEQDGLDDIATCVYAICATNPGDRDEMPTFGLTEMTFYQEPLPAQAAANQIATWEPRAQILIDQAPAMYDASVVNANVNVELLQGGST